MRLRLALFARWSVSLTTRASFVLFLAITSSGALEATPQDEIKTTGLHFVEAKPSEQFKAAVSRAFTEAHFVRLKYTPAGTSEGAVDQNNVTEKWAFSITQNCSGPCSRTSSAIRARIATARRVDRDCPLPFDMALELLNANEKVIETFVFGIGGVCFSFRGSFYAVAPNRRIGKTLSAIPFGETFLFQ
jgi:hypothetical protein